MTGLPQGVFGYVYGGQKGLGCGYLLIEGNVCTGQDTGPATFVGNIRRAPYGSGYIIEGSLTAPPGVYFVAGSSEQDMEVTHHISIPLPEDFMNGQPFQWPNGYGPCNAMCTKYSIDRLSTIKGTIESLARCI